MKTGIIYLHKNNINKKCYIGSTIQDPVRRWRKVDKTYHSYKSCTVFFKALKKYGWDNFTTTVLEKEVSFDDISKREEFYINYYDSIAPRGYNTVNIIDGRVVFTNETRKKISESRKKYYANLEEPVIAWNKKDHLFIKGVESKRCPRCTDTFPITFFSNDKTNWDNLNTYCRSCGVSYSKKYIKTLSKEDFKKSYIERTIKMKKSIIENYKNNPETKHKISEAKKRPLRAVHKITGEVLLFESGLEAKEKGFHSPNIGKAMKLNKTYKGYYWSYENKEKKYLVFDHEIADPIKNRIWKSIKNNNKHSVFARKCIIKEIGNNEYRDFVSINHLQGYVPMSVSYGLYYKEELLAVMSFGKPRYNKKYEWELLRFCSKLDTRVVGGASKLLHKFINSHSPTNIISYANKRFSEGNLYEKIGFKYLRTSNYGYFYKKDGKVHNRSKFMKHKLKNKLDTFDPELTEKQNMINNGYTILFDRGNLVYEWTYS